MWKSFLALLAAAAFAPAAGAAPKAARPAATVASLREALAGEWSGALGYKDYQTGRLTELSVRTTIRRTGDGLTQTRVSRFDEGRSRPPVFTTTISGFVSDPTQLVSAFFRQGRAAELQTETVVLRQYKDPSRWTIIYSQTGEDDDKPALIRVTETRDGDQLLAVKEVRPVSPADAPWSFRNQIRLRRAAR